MGRYEECRHIVLVDTLDNTGFGVQGKESGLFGLSCIQLVPCRPSYACYALSMTAIDYD